MAFRDYIICGECETKIIYDGYDNGRDRLEELWGDPKADFWTVHLLCPDCLKKLRAERDEALADAARYRWLRDVGNETWLALGKRPGVRFTHEVDAAIDAAAIERRT